MTFKEFREMARGIHDWQLFVIGEGGSTWHYGYEETLDSQYDNLRVISFDIHLLGMNHVTCTVDLI